MLPYHFLISAIILFCLTLNVSGQSKKDDRFAPFEMKYHSYWTPPEYTDFKSPFEYEKEVLKKLYVCEEEYLLGLSKRKTVLADMNLSKRQQSDSDQMLKKIKRLQELLEDLKAARNANAKSPDDQAMTVKSTRLEKEFGEQLESIRRSFRRTFTQQERNRLRNFRNRIILKTRGVKTTLNELPRICNSADYVVSDELLEVHKQAQQNLRKFSLTYWARIKVELPDEIASGPLFYWLEEITGDKKAQQFKNVYDELGHGYFSELIMEEFDAFEESPLKKDALSLTELWERKGQFSIFPDGSTERKIEKTSEPGGKVFLENLAKSPTYQRFFEMTPSQCEAAKDYLAEVKSKDKGFFEQTSISDLLGNVLLPHQLELIEERAAWREVELFGVVAAIVHGRLATSLKLNEKQKKQLTEKAKSIRETFEKYETEKAGRLDSELKVFLEANGLGELYSIAFGETPKTNE